jgi:prepilin-type N-terminal cleavage/methylation domain-containing protein
LKILARLVETILKVGNDGMNPYKKSHWQRLLQCCGPWLKRATRGFTLAELLIALTVLGVIASFTIPKILTSNNAVTEKSKWKEVYGAIAQVYHEGYTQRTLVGGQSSSTVFNYFASKLNTVRICNSHLVNQGCAPGDGYLLVNRTPSAPGFVKHNGAFVMLYGIQDFCGWRTMHVWFVDINDPVK